MPDIHVLDMDDCRKSRRTRIANVYDNWVGEVQLLGTGSKKMALEDIDWDTVLGRSYTIIAGDFNAYSPIWNSFCHVPQRVEALEEFIEKHDLLLNNDTRVAMRFTNSTSKSIIDLTFHTLKMSPLDMWYIDPEVTTPSDYNRIMFELWEIWLTVPVDQITG